MSDYSEHLISMSGGDGEPTQAYIVECDDMVGGDRIWFESLLDAEDWCGPFPSCCIPKPVGADYDGPKWVPEDDQP